MIAWLLFAGSILAAGLSLCCNLYAGLCPLRQMRRWEGKGSWFLGVSISLAIVFFGITLAEVLAL